MIVQKFILGDQVIGSEMQKRKTLLGMYLVLMYLGVDFFFFIVSLINPQGEPFSLFGGVVVSLICLFLIRWKHIDLAMVLHLLRANFLAFFFSRIDIDPYQTGTYLYFIPSSLGALAVFGYKERWKGILFSLLSLVLFLVAMLRMEDFSPDNAHFYFIVSYIIIFLIAILIILFFDRLVIRSEEKLMERNLELVKANEELDKFVYSASHDLRAPLSSVLGLVDISRRSGNPEEIGKYLELIKLRVHDLDAFIQEIIDYSRNARTAISRELIEMGPMLKEVMAGLSFTENANRIQLKLLFDPSMILNQDRYRLRIIFNNLLSNTIKYQDKQKDSSFVNVGITKTGDVDVITVEDNGIGIKSEYLGKIFDMFYRASESSKGSGLGLYILRETVTRLGGTVKVESELGKGTVFRIELPRGH